MYEFKKYKKGMLDKSISKCTRIGDIYRGEGRNLVWLATWVCLCCVIGIFEVGKEIETLHFFFFKLVRRDRKPNGTKRLM